MRLKSIPFVLFLLVTFFLLNKGVAQTVDMVGPVGSGAYGTSIKLLTNGNYVITDPSYSEGGAANIGAVYLYNGVSNILISTLKGSTANDMVGTNVITLNNGNFVVCSTRWNNGTATSAGAATWCNGNIGINGRVDSSNSLVGSQSNDRVGQVTSLTNGNYVVGSVFWSNGSMSGAGAVTWCDGTKGLSGTINSNNSLIGTFTNDNIGVLAPLSNGNYVAGSPAWHNGIISNAGAATWCSGTTGLTGVITASNSFVGLASSSSVGERVFPLQNGNYLILSNSAITWANGATGITGSVNSTNSWTGTYPDNQIDNVVVLANSNYLVVGKLNGEISVTWANGNTGSIGARTTSNSFLSGLSIIALGNGNYILSNPYWNGNKGAAILCQADGSTTGTFNSTNSLTGANTNDYIGSGGIIPLINNNFVVCSPNWNGKRGAATLCQSNGSTLGVVNSSNSLVGTNVNDSVGCGAGIVSYGGATALTNGNYVVISHKWNNNKGAITWGNGLTGITGQINSTNSLIGTIVGDKLGNAGTYREIIPNYRDTLYNYPGVFALGNGNYIVASVGWNNNTGSVTLGNGKTGTIGTVNSQNSLIGVTNIYNPGNIPFLASVIPSFTYDPIVYEITGLTYYNYYSSTSYSVSGGNGNVYLKNFSNDYLIQGINANTNKATITWGNGAAGTTGFPNSCNTIYGAISNGVNNMNYGFDSIYNYLLVSRPAENIVSRYYPALGAALPSNNDNSSTTISGNSPFIFPTTTGCGQIAALTPSGANPVSGSVIAKTWLESPQPTYFVVRHYEITPATNPTTSTGTITLFFTQADFDGFNNQNPAPASLLPNGPNDAVGKSHLLVQKEGGVSNVGTGLPGTYPGAVTTINPDDSNIVWNTALQRWEVTFDVTGFSGFFIKTAATTIVLPLQLLNFSGNRQGNSNLLQWTTSNEVGTKTFVVESSANGNSFAPIGNVAATGSGKYSFTDNNPIANRTYYRLKMVDVDGKFTYSNIIWISTTGRNNISVYPNPVSQTTTLNISNNNQLIGTKAQLTDAGGRLLQQLTINHSQEQLNMTALPAGLYLLKLNDGTVVKMMKQ